MDCDILPATSDDAPAILALQLAAYRSEALLYGEDGVPPLAEGPGDMAEAFGRLCFLKAVARGADQAERLVGSVRAGLSGEVCEVGRLIVHPDFQRRGLGSALLRAAEALFPQAMRLRLFTGHKSEGNLRLYARHGYRQVEARAVSPALTLLFLEKPGPGSTAGRS